MSIRVRVTVIAIGAVTVVMVVAAVALVVIQRQQMIATIDSTLTRRADEISAILQERQLVAPDLVATRDESFTQLVAAQADVLASTPNLAGAPALPIPQSLSDAQTLRTLDTLTVDDDTFRVLSRTVDTPNGPALLHVGATIDVVEESVGVLLGTLALTTPIVVGLMGAIVWALVGRTLRPVEDIRREVAEIGSLDLHRRVPLPLQRDEVGRLARTMNEMLGRLESAVTRQRRFVADASHELRSPLARMRSELETADEKEASPLLTSLHEEVVHLQNLAEDLLVLAHHDDDPKPARSDPVDLDDIVLEEAAAMGGRGRVQVHIAGVSAAHVRGDARELRRAIQNLCENAERHATSLVSMTLREVGNEALFDIADDGPGIPPNQADIVFERFTRLDHARNRASGGTGLGLAIVREIIERHGGQITIDTTHRPGARFVMRLPRA